MIRPCQAASITGKYVSEVNAANGIIKAKFGGNK
jgi:hypothetical protein